MESCFWQVNDDYARSLEILSKKLKFVKVDPLINASKALKDIKEELERLRQNALSKVSAHIIEIFFAMKKPGTNIQILQQNLLQKHGYLILFLKEHGSEMFGDLCASYVDTMNKVLSTYFRVYVEALERLKLDIGASSDVSGHDISIIDIATRGRNHLRDHRFMFSLGERANILKEIDQPGLVPHISQVNSRKYPYEVIFRSLQKLLMDTASSEYLSILFKSSIMSEYATSLLVSPFYLLGIFSLKRSLENIHCFIKFSKDLLLLLINIWILLFQIVMMLFVSCL